MPARLRELLLLLLAFTVVGVGYVVVWSTYSRSRLAEGLTSAQCAQRRSDADALLARYFRFAPRGTRPATVATADGFSRTLHNYRTGRRIAWRTDAPTGQSERQGIASRYLTASDLPPWEKFLDGSEARLFLPPALMLLAWVAVSVALWRRGCRETLLVPIVALLTALGLLFELRLAAGADVHDLRKGVVLTGPWLYGLYMRQLVSFAIAWAGLMAALLFLRDFRSLARFRYLLAALAVLLLILTTAFGADVGGQTVTLSLGPFAFQPHEPVKLLLILFVSAYISEHRALITAAAGRFGLLTRADFRYMGPLLVLWAFAFALVFLHDDLGTALLLFGTFLGMLYLGAGRWNYLLIGVALAVGGIWGGYHLGHVAGLGFADRLETRVAIWRNPWAPDVVDDSGFQIAQSLMALGSGRVVGAGLAGGYPERIPAIQTDMIYAAISEDLGLLGAAAVLGLFLVLIARLVAIALSARDRFGRLLVGGIAVAFGVQSWVIIAGVVKLIPLRGVTLPFMSFGGASLLTNFLLLALALLVASPPPRPA